MSHYRFSIPFFPFFGGGRHQEEKEAVLVDDSRCGRHRLMAIVRDESVGVLAPKCMLCYQAVARRDRQVVSNTIELAEILYRSVVKDPFKSESLVSWRPQRQDIARHAGHRYRRCKVCLSQDLRPALFGSSMQII